MIQPDDFALHFRRIEMLHKQAYDLAALRKFDAAVAMLDELMLHAALAKVSIMAHAFENAKLLAAIREVQATLQAERDAGTHAE